MTILKLNLTRLTEKASEGVRLGFELKLSASGSFSLHDYPCCDYDHVGWWYDHKSDNYYYDDESENNLMEG